MFLRLTIDFESNIFTTATPLVFIHHGQTYAAPPNRIHLLLRAPVHCLRALCFSRPLPPHHQDHLHPLAKSESRTRSACDQRWYGAQIRSVGCVRKQVRVQSILPETPFDLNVPAYSSALDVLTLFNGNGNCTKAALGYTIPTEYLTVSAPSFPLPLCLLTPRSSA